MSRGTLRLANIRTIGAGGLPIPVGPLSEQRVRSSLFRILDRTPVCSLATVGPENHAHSSHVDFAYSARLELYFLSDPASRHCRHLETNPSMAVSVYDSQQRWGGPDSGLALYGLCRMARGASHARAEAVYAARFRQYRGWRRKVRPGDEAAKWRFFRFVARRVKVFDEDRLGAGVFVIASVRANPLGAI
jgi:uncharacterized protein